MRRADNWNAQKRNACLSEFRRLVRDHRKDQVENAIAAGRSLAKLMADAHVVLTGIDDVQLERFRRRFAVHRNLKGVMYGVATGKIIGTMLDERLNQKFESYRLLSGRLRLVDRCPLCSKRTCRCAVVLAPKCKSKQHKKPTHPMVTVVSVRGL